MTTNQDLIVKAVAIFNAFPSDAIMCFNQWLLKHYPNFNADIDGAHVQLNVWHAQVKAWMKEAGETVEVGGE
jgi:hypothetical protein